MPADDIYHDPFVHALRKDGWTITHDPLTVTVEETRVMMDIGAERVVAAEREGERIAMDKIERYRQIIENILTPLTEGRYANADVQNEAVFDREKDRYIIVTTGWEGKDRRVYYNLVHLDIINGKVWIQRDGTEE